MCTPDHETGELSWRHAASASTSRLHLAQFVNCSHLKGNHLLALYFSDASWQMEIAGLCLDFYSRISSPDVLLCWSRPKIFPLFFLFSLTKIHSQDLNISTYFNETVNATAEGFGWPKRLLNKTCLAWQLFFKIMADDSLHVFLQYFWKFSEKLRKKYYIVFFLTFWSWKRKGEWGEGREVTWSFLTGSQSKSQYWWGSHWESLFCPLQK